MSYKKHELFILIEHQNSLPVFGQVCLAQFFFGGSSVLFFVLFVFVLCFVSYATCVFGMSIHDCHSVFSNMCAKVYKKNNQSNFQNHVHVHALSKRRLSTITKRLVSLSFLCFCFVLWVSCLNSSIDSSVLYSAALSGIQWILLKYYLPNLKDVTKLCSFLNILLPKGWFCIKTRAGETTNAIL